MSNHERVHDQLEQLTVELTDVHMLLDELLHVVRYIQRNGLGIYDADSRWLPERSQAVTIGLADETDIETDDGHTSPTAESGETTDADLPRSSPRSTLFD